MTESLPTDQVDTQATPKQRFEQEMAQISFEELQKFFARGVLIQVNEDLDLVEVALQIHADNTAQIQQWLDNKELERAHDEHAKKWVANQTRFMAVTVAPWVLVKELNER